MATTVGAMYDGSVLRLDKPLSLPANTRVRVTIEPAGASERTSSSFLQTALSLKLEGPADWSANLDSYLYGEDVATTE